MAVLSRLACKSFEKLELAKGLLASLKNGAQRKGLYYVPVRNSHDRTIEIRPSTYFTFKMKDLFYFYSTLGILIFGSIILYTNLFIGPAKLAVIPEGYTPKPWEYYQHPITRFFARYVTPSKQECYERSCHSLFVKQEKSQIMKLENKIKDFMKKREDYQAWYFEKPEVKYIRRLHEDIKEAFDDSAKGPGWIQ